MFGSDRPSQSIIQEAIAVGIENVQSMRNIDLSRLKSEYEKVKKALDSANESEEIRSRYTQFVALYDQYISTSSKATIDLKEEIKWKHIGDLREAVKNEGKGLSLADIEGLNQFARTEYGRQNRIDNPQRDESIVQLLNNWFRMYPTLKLKAIETATQGKGVAPREQREATKETVTLDEAIKTGFNSLISGKKIDPLTVLHEGKKYRFPLEVDETSFTLGGKKFTMNFPGEVRGGRFSFEKDEIVFSGRGESGSLRRQELFRVNKKEVSQLLSAQTGEIVFKSENGEIRITAKGSGEYLPIAHVIAESTPPVVPPPVASGDGGTSIRESARVGEALITLRWNGLPTYKGYAEQELAKGGKTVKDLQEKLKSLGFYKGEVNNIFDIATLNAVVLFQRDKKINDDGLVGPITMRELGFPQAARTPDASASHTASGTPGSRPSGAGDRPARPQGAPAVRPAEGVRSHAEELKITKSRYEAFLAKANELDKWFGGFHDSKDDIIQARKALDTLYGAFEESVEKYRQAGGDMEQIAYMRLNICYYYSNDLSGTNNTHYVDVIRSQNISIDILKGKISPLPTTEEQLYSTLDAIKNTNPKLASLIATKIAEQQAAGLPFNLGEILSNPLVKGGWERAYNEIFEGALKKLDNDLDRLKGQEWGTLSANQRKALDHLRDIRGKDGLFDLKTENKEQMWQMLRYGTAIGAGIGVTIYTGGLGSGALGLAATTIAGATVTTGATMLAQGYRGSVSEIAGEFGINTLSFGAGAVLYKIFSGANAARVSGIIGRPVVYSLEGGGNIAVGMGTDHLRAYLKGEDLDMWSSFQQNLVWAALPFALRMRGGKVPESVMNDAQSVQDDVARASVQARLGQSIKGSITGMKERLERLKLWGERQNVQRQAPAKFQGAEYTNSEIEDILSIAQSHSIRNKADIPGLPGYKISLTEDGKMIRIEGPDGRGGRMHADKLGENLNALKRRMAQNTGSAAPEGAPAPSVPRQAPSANDKLLHRKIAESFDTLKDGYDPISIGQYKIKKEGSHYYVTSGDETIRLTKKAAIKKVEDGINESAEKVESFLRSKIDEHIAILPEGKSRKYRGPDGEYSLSKKKGGGIEVVGPGGKVLEGEALEAFYKTQARNILDTRMRSFLTLHGDKPIGEVLHGNEWYKFKTFEGWAAWNAEKSKVSPIRWISAIGRVTAEQLYDSLKAPLKTAEAFRSGAMRDHWLGGDGRLNGLAKAIVLRDTHQNWVSAGAIGTVVGRGTLMTGALAIPIDSISDDNLFADMIRMPTLTAYKVSGQRVTESGHDVTSASHYYGGLIWGSIAARLISDDAPIPSIDMVQKLFSPTAGEPGANIPPPQAK